MHTSIWWNFVAADMQDGERAAILVDEPDRFDEFRDEYGSFFKYYRDLRNDAPGHLDFEGYLRLHDIFLSRDDGGQVREFVEENLARSLRNMVVRNSSRGSAYAVETLADLDRRRSGFVRLDVATPSLYRVAETVVESLYDDDWHGTVRTMDALLRDTAGCPSAVVNYLARVRTTAALRRGQAPDDVRRAYVAVTDPLEPDGPGTAEGCLEQAEFYRRSEPERTAYVQTALHRPDATDDLLFEFLHLAAVNAIETARHRHRDDEVSRGTLGFAILQLDVLLARPETGDARGRWLRAYRYVTEGLLASGGRWLSTRDTPPSVDFKRAASQYWLAAVTLEDAHPKRSLTYLSKAYRMLAHTTNSPKTRAGVHKEAVAEVLDRVAAYGSDVQDDSNARERAISIVDFHRFAIQKLWVPRHCWDCDYTDALAAYEDAESLLADLDHPAATLDDVTALADIARAVRAEGEHEFDEAEFWFESARADYGDVLHGPRAVDFGDRIAVTRYKECLAAGEYIAAREELTALENNCAVLVAAADVLAGEPVEKRSLGNLNSLPGIDYSATRVLRNRVGAYVDADEQLPDAPLVRAALRV